MRLVHELIETLTGVVLFSAVDSEHLLDWTAQFVASTGISTEELSYIILINGSSAKGRVVASGEELRRMVEDYKDRMMDRWEDEGGTSYGSDDEY